MKAKPICVIYLPDNYSDMNGKRNWIYDFMRFLNGEKSEGSRLKWDEVHDFSEYHWFCFYKPEIDAPELKVFFQKDFTEIQYQELKSLIEKSINNIQP